MLWQYSILFSPLLSLFAGNCFLHFCSSESAWDASVGSPWVSDVNQYLLIWDPPHPSKPLITVLTTRWRLKTCQFGIIWSQKVSQEKDGNWKDVQLLACNSYWWQMHHFFQFNIFCSRTLFCLSLSILWGKIWPGSLNGSDLTHFLVETFSPRIFPRIPAFRLHHYRTQFRPNMSDTKIMAVRWCRSGPRSSSRQFSWS